MTSSVALLTFAVSSLYAASTALIITLNITLALTKITLPISDVVDSVGPDCRLP